MKLENWDVHQTESVENDGSIITQVSVFTYDDIDPRKLIEWIKSYDPEFDLDEYKTLIKAKEEDIKHHDFFRGRSPEQIVQCCNDLYDAIQREKPGSVYNRKRLKVGIEILQGYNIFWTPPRNNSMQTIVDICGSTFNEYDLAKIAERLQSLSAQDQRSLINKLWETADEIYLHNKHKAEQNKQSDDLYKDLPYEGKMVGCVFRRPRDE